MKKRFLKNAGGVHASVKNRREETKATHDKVGTVRKYANELHEKFFLGAEFVLPVVQFFVLMQTVVLRQVALKMFLWTEEI